MLVHPARHPKDVQPEEALCRTRHSAACQVESSWLCFSIFGASVSVLGPKSFSWTTPSWVTMKVITPDDSYSAGCATRAAAAVFLPRIAAAEFPLTIRK